MSALVDARRSTMGTIGKVCLIITILLLMAAVTPIPLPYGGWGPGLLVIHNGWSEQLYAGEESVVKAQTANLEARQEYAAKVKEMEALQFGWDRTWNVSGAQVGGKPFIAVNGNRVALYPGSADNDPDTIDDVVNLITNKQVQIPNAVGLEGVQSGTLIPQVFLFYSEAGANNQATSYLGEFTVSPLNQNGFHVLNPVHTDPEAFERLSSVQNPSWRVRTMIRSQINRKNEKVVDDVLASVESPRSRIDGLFRNLDELAASLEATQEAQTRADSLLAASQAALDAREKELLGDPDREPVNGRPEFTQGLKTVTERVEEERAQLLLEIDDLRRRIMTAGEQQDLLLESLQRGVDALPAPENGTAKASPRIAAGK